MKEYLELLDVLRSQPKKDNRTSQKTRGIVYNHMEFEPGFHFPAVTTKFLPMKSVLGELLGFIRGADSAATFRELGCRVWDANANESDPAAPNKWLTSPFRRGEDDLGRIYGVQWRNWRHHELIPEGHGSHLIDAGYYRVGNINALGAQTLEVWELEVDQLKNAVREIKNNPGNRRIIISAWNPGELDQMALPPCHVLQHYICEPLSVQERREAAVMEKLNDTLWNDRSILTSDLNTEEATKRLSDICGKYYDDTSDGLLENGFDDNGDHDEQFHAYLDTIGAPKHKLNLIMYQRSADSILGVPFNIASYSAMLIMMSRITGTMAGTFHYVTGDTHMYENHMAALQEQLDRVPYTGPMILTMNPEIRTLERLERAVVSDFALQGYVNAGKLENETKMVI